MSRAEPTDLPDAPLPQIEAPDGSMVPFRVVTFDKEGECTSPETRDALVAYLAEGDITDVFVFSHGWNNDWRAAINRYQDFIEGFLENGVKGDWQTGRPVAPLLVGIFWPSTTLVMPWEQAPNILAIDEANDEDLTALLDELDPEDAERLRESIADDDLEQLASILSPLLGGSDDAPPEADLTAAELEALLRSSGEGRYSGAGTTKPLDGDDEVEYPSAQAAGGPVSAIRDAIRATTVHIMKDRAGVVGSNGVAALVDSMSAASPANVHLIGHSFGAKVVLSAALASNEETEVTSMLLLQPAVSRLCFAKDRGDSQSGGYRTVMDRVRLPVMTTFSNRDQPLRKFFHWAVVRKVDVGDVRVAGVGDEAKYGALGGYGPTGCEGDCIIVDIHDPGDPYDLGSTAALVVGLKADDEITGHSEISNPHTYWALQGLLAASPTP